LKRSNRDDFVTLVTACKRQSIQPSRIETLTRREPAALVAKLLDQSDQRVMSESWWIRFTIAEPDDDAPCYTNIYRGLCRNIRTIIPRKARTDVMTVHYPQAKGEWNETVWPVFRPQMMRASHTVSQPRQPSFGRASATKKRRPRVEPPFSW